ncbi:hypothetical protein Sru01_59830 [Sphaerisporangium rufum]|uniref:YtkA-like domain-containing protein n=1 Tax=Sphaerisporangium rufum TaxID=1381558 RepID=A0A919R9P2_9ACTN|nr:FixH family protein [Sphaerisporangium rufum]GII81001.1 hypothetical protein Sru01_59830 [Sphaerisporangium rufum]
MTRAKRLLVLAFAALVAAAVAAFAVARASGADPVTAAGTRYTVTVTAARDTIDVRVDRGAADTVTIAAVMPAMGHAMPEVTARKAAPGHFVAEGGLFSMDGGWELSVRLTGPAGEETLTLTTLVGD